MNFPSLDQSNMSNCLGHPAITILSCQASRRQVASLLASALERLVHRAFHAWHTAKATGWVVEYLCGGYWATTCNDPTFQGQAVACSIAIKPLLFYLHQVTLVLVWGEYAIRYTALSWFGWSTSVGWSASQALRLQAEQAQEALAQRLASSMVVEQSVASSVHHDIDRHWCRFTVTQGHESLLWGESWKKCERSWQQPMPQEISRGNLQRNPGLWRIDGIVRNAFGRLLKSAKTIWTNDVSMHLGKLGEHTNPVAKWLLAKRQTSCQRAAKSSHQIMHRSPLHLLQSGTFEFNWLKIEHDRTSNCWLKWRILQTHKTHKAKRSYKKWFLTGNVTATSQLRQLLVRNVVAFTWPMRCRGPSRKKITSSLSVHLPYLPFFRPSKSSFLMFSKTQIGKMFGFKRIQQHDTAKFVQLSTGVKVLPPLWPKTWPGTGRSQQKSIAISNDIITQLLGLLGEE